MFGPLPRATLLAALVLPFAACSPPAEDTAPRYVVPEPPPPDPVLVAKEAEYREQLDAGQKATGAKQPDAAIGHFERAVAAKPKGFEAQLALARAYAARKDDEKAIKAYAAATDANPRLGDAYLERAALLDGAGRLEDARQEYALLIREELDPKLTAKAHWLRSDLSDRLGKRADYRYDRTEAMKLDPDLAARVTGGDVVVVNHTGTPLALSVDHYETPTGAAGTLPKDYRFSIPGNTSAYLVYEEKPVSARSVRFTITVNDKSKQYTMAYTKGVSLEIPIRNADLPR